MRNFSNDKTYKLKQQKTTNLKKDKRRGMEVGGRESGSKPEDDCEDGRQVNYFLTSVFFF